MIIGVCGYGYTGSGAVIDLLKEYSDVCVKDDFEFTLTYWPDSIEDLEYQLMKKPARFFSSDMAINRFLKFIKKENVSPKGWYKTATNGKFCRIAERYVDKIVQLQWNGRWMIDPFLCNEVTRTFKYRLLARIQSRFHISCLEKLLDRKMYFSICPEEFYNASREFVAEVIAAMGADDFETIVLNQPFAANNPKCSMNFFENPKAIIVDRDPRDTYVLMREHIDVKWAPVDCVEDFIVYYERLRLSREKCENILYIQFEDLVYRYAETVAQIEEFCGCKKHDSNRKYFNPNISIRNTQLFVDNHKYEKEIQLIEKNLNPFLYNFSGLEKKGITGKVF